MDINLTTISRGEITAKVFSNSGELKQEITKNNLLTNGRANSGFFFNSVTASACFLAEGSVNPRVEPDAGTVFTKSNNLITRGGSTWDCSILRSGDQIKFADGSRVVVDEAIDSDSFNTFELFFSPESFAPQSGVVYLTRETESTNTTVGNGTLFGSQYAVAQSAETIVSTDDRDNWSAHNEFEILFNPTGEAGVVNFFGITNVCRVFLPTPLVLEPTDFVRITYRVFVNSATGTPVQQSPDFNAAGWPHQYNVSTMSSDGSNILMTIDDDHHYEVGDTLLIQNATPTQIPLTSVSSNGVTITVVSAGHNFSAGQNMSILATNNYDGNYTVDSVVDTDTFTITSGVDVATETSGFVHDSTPANYYNQEFEVSSIPAPNQVELTSTLDEPTTNNGVVSVPDTGFTFTDASSLGFHRTSLSFPNDSRSGYSSTERYDSTTPFGGLVSPEFTARNTNISLPIRQDLTGGQDLVFRLQMSFLATRDYGRIKQFFITDSASFTTMNDFYLTFDHIQTKKDLYSLNLNVELAHLQELT